MKNETKGSIVTDFLWILGGILCFAIGWFSPSCKAEHATEYSKTLPIKVTKSYLTTPTYRVKATVYYPTGNATYSGRIIPPDFSNKSTKWVAISHDLRKHYKWGDTVLVTGTDGIDGKYIVVDLMNRRWKRKLDILVRKGEARGMWHNVQVRKLTKAYGRRSVGRN